MSTGLSTVTDVTGELDHPKAGGSPSGAEFAPKRHPCGSEHPITFPRLRLVYFLDSFRVGGTEMNAVRTVEALDPRLFEISVLHLQDDGPLRARYEKLGVPMFHMPIASLYSPTTAAQGFRFARLLRALQVDVLHTHDLYTNIFACPWARLLSSCKVVASRRWWREAPRAGLVPLNRLSNTFAHRILANSSSVAKLLVDEEHVPQSKVVEIPNFIDDRTFMICDEPRRREVRMSWGIPDGGMVLGIVARLVPVKNHHLLLRALSLLPDFVHLVIAGDGSCRAELEAFASSTGIRDRVHFLGEIAPNENVQACFDVSVLCSLSEGFPNSVIEAMAAARPVVCTDVGGIRDVVVHGSNGLLVPSGNVAELANALHALVNDHEMRKSLGEKGQRTVRARFHRDVVMAKLVGMYLSLAGRANSQTRQFS